MAGAVRDDAGDPVVGNEMRAFRRTITDGQAAWRPLGLTRTDDRGEYRFGNLLPGTFVVCACGTDSIPFDRALLTSLAAQPMQLLGVAGRALSVGGDAAVLDSTLRTFAPTFFPSASTVGESTRVILAAGEDRRGVDITTCRCARCECRARSPGASVLWRRARSGSSALAKPTRPQ